MEQESTRAKKIGKLIHRDISDIFQKELSALSLGTLVSVTVVRMSPDFGVAKVYLSIFPFEKHKEVLDNIKKEAWQIRVILGKRVRNQLRTVPELAFFLDDSMEYADNIESIFRKIEIKPEEPKESEE